MKKSPLSPADRAVAIVGVGAVLPDAPDATTFWQNVIAGKDSITEVPGSRWSVSDYYDPDPKAPGKTYSKIGGWATAPEFDSFKYRIPPKVAQAMDEGQKWGVLAAGEALRDSGHPDRPLDTERVGVIVGNAMGGERHYQSCIPLQAPEYTRVLSSVPSFLTLPPTTKAALIDEFVAELKERYPDTCEDTMPGELTNIMAGRIASVFNLRGPNYTTDAACASSLAALDAAIQGLVDHHFDAVISGGMDRNMGATTFIKFCKIGALSPDGSRPYADGANGFVMGEGGAMFLLKRLADAENDGDRIYAVIRSVGASSDGKGKGITAPNPIGQRLAFGRAWERAGESPASMTLLEGHGTSTRVGDVVEVESASEMLNAAGAAQNTVALGSIKSQIGHLKSGAGAAGLLKAVLAVHHKILPPSINFHAPNPKIDYSKTPFFVNTSARPWERPANAPRRAGVSSFGFGGTNFHVVVEEHIPGSLTSRKASTQVPTGFSSGSAGSHGGAGATTVDAKPLGDLLALGGDTPTAVRSQLADAAQNARSGRLPSRQPPADSVLSSEVRLCIAFDGAQDLVDKCDRALKAFDKGNPTAWRLLRSKGVHYRSGDTGKLAFLFPGQGSQYVNMLRTLRDREPVVAETFAEADEVMTPILGRPLTSYLFSDTDDPAVKKEAEAALRDTTICQPAVLSCDVALTRLFQSQGIRPDFVMGHSLGEWGAVVASGMLSFADALVGVSARAKGMASVSLGDTGKMASVLGPYEEIEAHLAKIEGYLVPANINSRKQTVIAGASEAIDRAVDYFNKAGFTSQQIPVSHAFHSKIVAPAAEVMRETLGTMQLAAPQIPLVGNVEGEFYPQDQERVRDLLAMQLASPVRFVKGLETLYRAGARMFVEVGPKRVLQGFAEDVLGDRDGVLCLSSNHPKRGDVASFHEAMCGLYAAGLPATDRASQAATPEVASAHSTVSLPKAIAPMMSGSPATATTGTPSKTPDYEALGRVFAKALQEGLPHLGAAASSPGMTPVPSQTPSVRGAVVVSGAGLGLPGQSNAVFADDNAERILRGDCFLETVPQDQRESMLAKNIVRLHKREVGEPSMEPISSTDEVVRLAARRGAFDLAADFGVPVERVDAYDISTSLAIAAGLEALRDAGIPLVRHYRKTTIGSTLPDRWLLPRCMADETGVVFASAFPGVNNLVDHLQRYHAGRFQRLLLEELHALRKQLPASADTRALDERMSEIERAEAENRYTFDRKFLFQILSMGHSQFAELVGVRGPNTQINSACASTTQAVSLAEDWIRAGRCRRVLVIGADDVTSDELLGWIGSGFLASGAATTEDQVDKAALPFDRRRNGMLLGMGACALVIEDQAAVQERGMRGLAELLATETANSAFHGTRLDVDHISGVMNRMVTSAEQRYGLNRGQMANEMVFVSHETYTPARGGSASAEVKALRQTFGDQADSIVVCNTKGFTGHPQGVGLEDAVAIKILEKQVVPPVPNYKEPDPELGHLNLSNGGEYPVQYALRLAAGFGSQVSMTLTRRVARAEERVADANGYQAWLSAISGQSQPVLEVDHRTLRIVDVGRPERDPVESSWRFGDLPSTELHGGPTAKSSPQPAPAPATPPTPATALAASDVPTSNDSVAERVLSVVSEKTGYPVDMLERDLDLEADLGIDTVKQAEVFAMVREAFDIPRQDDLKLSEYPTLEHVIGFVRSQRPDLATAPAPTQAASTAATSVAVAAASPSSDTPVSDDIADRVLAVVSDKTGYPVDMLERDLDLEADLGIDTVKQAEVFAMVREAFDIPRQDDLKLSEYPTLEHVIGFVRSQRPDLAQTAPRQASPATQAPTPSSVPAETGDDVADKVLAVVSEKTGYPADMLERDLDLEADLGIDTVKQAEVFAMVREAFGIPRQDDLKLSEYPTLEHVIGFVRDNRPAAAATEESGNQTSADEKTRAPTEHTDPLLRVPVPALRPELLRCEPSGVDLTPGRRVLVVADTGGVGDTLKSELTSRGLEVLFVSERMQPSALEALLSEWAKGGELAGVYFLPALDSEQPHNEIDLDAWRTLNRERALSLRSTARALYSHLGSSTFLVTATRMGGLHGYGGSGARNPSGGAVSGLTKALSRERSESLVKVVDFAHDADNQAVAQTLLGETERDPGACEIGHRVDQRFAIASVDHQAASLERRQPMSLDSDTVFMVTGAAGDVTAAIVEDLATASGGTFHLMDLRPEPDAQTHRDVKRLNSDRAGLQREIFDRLKAAGERATPAMVERQLFDLERAAAIIGSLEAVKKSGGQAHYHSVDVMNPAAVASAVDKVRAANNRLDVIVHAAGIERSRFLDQKTDEEFDLVFGVKSDGLFNLLHSTEPLKPRALVCFSSVAGRFGNGGQTDYSAGNDLMCKLASNWAERNETALAVVLDWTAWSGIGMATRGGIPEMMRRAGIEMLDPGEAIPVVREMLTTGFCGEAVVGRRLGMLLEPATGRSGVDASSLISSATGLALPIEATGHDLHGGLQIELRLDPNEAPFLRDHEIEGTPVLPGVMGLEVFAEVCSLVAPKHRIASIYDIRFAAPMKYFRREPRAFTVRALPLMSAKEGLRVLLSLTSTQEIMGKTTDEKEHFRAVASLADQDDALTMRKVDPMKLGQSQIDSDEIYRVFFHGPAYQVLSKAQPASDTELVGQLNPSLPSDTLHPDRTWSFAPRLVELCFQTAGVWGIGKTGQLGLPAAVDRVSVGNLPDGKPVAAEVTARTSDDGHRFDIVVRDDDGNVYLEVEGYRTAMLPGTVLEDRLTPFKGVATP